MKPREPSSAGHIAVFGAGIAGLTVAHELVRRGHRVTVCEARNEAGGFFRSARQPGTGMPTEYSWHGFGPWYHNAFDLLRQIPFDERGSIYERGLSRPIEFGIFPNRGRAGFYRGLTTIPRMFGWSGLEAARWWWVMLRAWTAGRRSERDYAGLNAAAAWSGTLRMAGFRRWRSCFGPWIGSDWTRVSLHTAGRFFCRQLTSRPSHPHPADEDGPGWSHGARDGWLLLRAPSSECWFDRWLTDLRARGVAFRFSTPLQRLDFDGQRIQSAVIGSDEILVADHYVLATDPFTAAKVVERSRELANVGQLRKLARLIGDGPHVQVSFRLAFRERVNFPGERIAVVVADSPYNLTLFAEEQVWTADVFLGNKVRSLWTGTSCVSSVPGMVHGLPVERCTCSQFKEEVLAQITACGSLDAMLRAANQGRGFTDFALIDVEVWHEWLFSPDGITSAHPKWVNSTRTQAHHPDQRTPVPNLFLTGAHTRTAADVWSVEGAVESGRRAAAGIDPRVTVLPQYLPPLLRWCQRADDACHSRGLPHFIDLVAAAGMILIAFAAVLTAI